MSVFVDLPDDLCKDILLEQLDARCWGVLEVALGKTLGSTFLRNLKSLVFPLINSWEDFSDYRSLYKWAFDRGVTLEELVLTDSLFADQILKFDCSFVRLESIVRLQLDNFPDASFSDLINACPSMTSLVCFSAVNFSKVDVTVLLRLKSLLVHDDENTSSFKYVEILSSLTQCRSLTALSFVLDVALLSPPLIGDILQNCKDLVRLELPACNALLQEIARVGTNLQMLMIRTDIDFSSSLSVLQNCRELNVFEAKRWLISRRDSKFTLKDFWLESAVVWQSVGRELSYIHSLDITDTNSFAWTMPLLFEAMGPHLTKLRLCNVSSENVRTFLSHCGALTDLNLSDTVRLDWTVLLPLTCQLEYLQVKCAFRKDCILTLLKRFKNLKKCVLISTWLGCSLEDQIEISDLRSKLKEYRNVDNVNTKFHIEWETSDKIFSLKLNTLEPDPIIEIVD